MRRPPGGGVPAGAGPAGTGRTSTSRGDTTRGTVRNLDNSTSATTLARTAFTARHMIRLSVRKTLGVNTPPWHSSGSQRPNERGDHPRRPADKDVVGRQPRNKTDELTG